MPGRPSESFDEHERPTAQRARPEGEQAPQDPNATTRIKPFDLEQLVQKGSGTRPVVTPEQIDRYRRDREGSPSEGSPSDVYDRETVDALALQRETLIIKPPDNPQTTAQQIPIEVDLSRITLPLAARRTSQRGVVFLCMAIAVVSALLGFVAGRL